MSQPRLRVAICGGGVGGLSLAVVLGKYCSDINIDLYEALPQFTEIGAGISIWKRTWVILKELGLDVGLEKLAVEPPVEGMGPGFIFRKSDTSSDGFTFHTVIVPHGSVTFHRADMLKVLTDNLPPPPMFKAHFRKRLVTYSQPETGGAVSLHFSDGTSTCADLLIGADGIKSATRASMYASMSKREENKERAQCLSSFIEASWSGTYAYRALVETQKLINKFPHHQAARSLMMYCGKNKHVVSYPISQGRFINIVAFVTVLGGEGKKLEGPAVIDVEKRELTKQYSGWEPELIALLDCVESPSKWAISHILNLPSYTDGPVALVGDSAHAMTTHLGAGAGQAIEDSFILGRLLASHHATKLSISKVLQVYNEVRRPFGNRVVDTSRRSGFLYEFNDPTEGPTKREISIDFQKLSEAISKNWEIQWTELPDTLWNEAQRLLHLLIEKEGRPILSKY